MAEGRRNLGERSGRSIIIDENILEELVKWVLDVKLRPKKHWDIYRISMRYPELDWVYLVRYPLDISWISNWPSMEISKPCKTESTHG